MDQKHAHAKVIIKFQSGEYTTTSVRQKTALVFLRNLNTGAEFALGDPAAQDRTTACRAKQGTQ